MCVLSKAVEVHQTFFLFLVLICYINSGIKELHESTRIHNPFWVSAEGIRTECNETF